MKSVVLFLALPWMLASESVEQCLVKALKPEDPSFLFASDVDLITTATLEFQLLPESLKTAFLLCTRGRRKLALDACEKRFEVGACEECGLVAVQKCPAHYHRVDCGLCALSCPHETTPEAAGALCLKPRTQPRETYESEADCAARHQNCTPLGLKTAAPCPPKFKLLGPMICSFECPEGFLDTGKYCEPPLVEQHEHFMEPLSDFHSDIRVESSNL